MSTESLREQGPPLGYIVVKEEIKARPTTKSGGGNEEPADAVDLRFDFYDIPPSDLPQLDDHVGDEGSIIPAFPLKLLNEVPAPDKVGLQHSSASDISWGLSALGADICPYDGTGVKVAILDSGIERNHDALKGKNVVCRNFTNGADEDTDGHGTHCAATIFGDPVQGARVGVAPGISAAIVGKVASGGVQSSSWNLLQAIRWAVDEGANIISMSVGFDFAAYFETLRLQYPNRHETMLLSELLDAYSKTVQMIENVVKDTQKAERPPLIVAAVGNESDRELQPPRLINPLPPSNSEGVLSVGSVGRTSAGLLVSNFSNRGPALVAPGVDVVSAGLDNGLACRSGTSVATPHVAGVAALWGQYVIEDRGSFKRDVVSSHLIARATRSPLSPDTRLSDVGSGLPTCPKPS